MDRSAVRELHYITRLENVRSIMSKGILSNARAQALKPASFALDSAQARRAVKMVIPGHTVHTYANVYFDAHNPTLSARRDQNPHLAVLRVQSDVLDIPGTFIATQNAASAGVTFHPSPAGLALLDPERVYADFWLHEDPAVKAQWGYAKCAEVLVPDVIPPRHVVGAFVCSTQTLDDFMALESGLDVRVNAGIYF